MVIMSREHCGIVDLKYHKRSNVDSANSATKRKFGISVRCKLPTAQKNEEAFSGFGYNLSLVPRVINEFDVVPPFIIACLLNTF